ncbi:MAG: ribosome recycling factor [Bacteroidales bacterium]|nr:ribosome recycling factor [Bacteroidales bacterium]
MQEDIKFVMDVAEESMVSAIQHLEKELTGIRAGKADPKMLLTVLVDYYGTDTPLNQVANINTPDARTIAIQPWEKQMIAPIERAIINSNLGFNPDNNGEIIRINIPVLTEERRKELTKQVHSEGEHARISIRNARRDAIDALKKLQKEGLSEDMEKDGEAEAQKLTDKYYKKVEERIQAKEKDIMTI